MSNIIIMYPLVHFRQEMPDLCFGFHLPYETFAFLIKKENMLLFSFYRFGISVPLTFLGAYLGFKKKVLI